MSTGPEHYREAERLLKGSKNSHGALVIEEGTNEVLLAAIGHALLANAAATALNDNSTDEGGMPLEDYRAWAEVAGVWKPKKKAGAA
ncbi:MULTISPECIES: hypothetical protein [Streptomyces]|uniref:hypothetical protein n=1 Tax=Streptomyces TaxID=1883 RepID=UPI00167A73FB|nr:MULTISPECIES: hypothetical protein [Streptomyces]MBK3524873.1 hypothetical protein [Streptomyces sp. MBT70]